MVDVSVVAVVVEVVEQPEVGNLLGPNTKLVKHILLSSIKPQGKLTGYMLNSIVGVSEGRLTGIGFEPTTSRLSILPT